MELSQEDIRAKKAAYMKAYYAKNKTKCRAINKRSKEKNGHLWPIDKDRALATRLRNDAKRTRSTEKDKDRDKHYNILRKQEAMELVKTRWAAWYEIPENRAAYLTKRKANYHPKKAYEKKKTSHTLLKQRVFDRYGGRCVCCGEDNFGFLTIDHVNGDGAKRRQEGEWKGIALYREIERNGFPTDMQILCWNCNIAKHVYGKCPHQLAAEHFIQEGLRPKLVA